MGSYIPSTKEERQEMLAAAGYDSIRSLFKDVPAEVYLDKPLNLPQGMSELEVRAKMQELAGKNTECRSWPAKIPCSAQFCAAQALMTTIFLPLLNTLHPKRSL